MNGKWFSSRSQFLIVNFPRIRKTFLPISSNTTFIIVTINNLKPLHLPQPRFIFHYHYMLIVYWLGLHSIIFLFQIQTERKKVKSLSCVRLSATPWTVAYQAPHPWDFPGKNTGVGCHFLLQEIFPTQGLNPVLPPFGTTREVRASICDLPQTAESTDRLA